MTLGYPQLRELISRGDVPAVADALDAADEPTRRAMAADLRGHRDEIARDWQRSRQEAGALYVAGAGCLPKAANVVSWLRDRRLGWHLAFGGGDARGSQLRPDHVVRVLSASGRPAIGVVARHLAERMRVTDVEWQWPLVWALLDASGIERPLSDNVVRGWVRYRLGRTGPWDDLPHILRTDPWLPAMLPRMFEVDGIGVELRGSWPRALAELSADGTVRREQVLGGCLLRLRSGERPSALRNILEVHEALAPTADDVAAHRQEYLGLLSSQSSTVAQIGQDALLRLDGAGRLPVDSLVEASQVLLLRPEKKLVRAQLSWLDRVARREPEQLPRVLEAAGVGLRHEALDLADRALALITRHLTRSGDDGRKAVMAAADGLTGDLGRRVSDLLGLDPPADEVVGGDPSPVAEAVQPFPPLVTSVAELAGEVTRLMRDVHDPITLERVLDGLVRCVRTDPAAVAAVLPPLVPGWFDGWVGALCEALRAGAREVRPRPPAYGTGPADDPAPPEELLKHRLVELSRQLWEGRPPSALLATPATLDGHVDPRRVLALLQEAERDGWQPGRADLTQAVLRLPRSVDDSVRAEAAALVSPAGRLLHRWLGGGGLTDPVVSRVVVRRKPCDHGQRHSYYHGYRCWCADLPAFRLTVEVPAPAPDLLAGLVLPTGLLHLPGGEAARARAFGRHWAPNMRLWPTVLPSHREIAAAHIQPLVAPAADRDRSGGTEVIPALARAAGPFGPAMAMTLAYGLAARRERDRLPAVDALVLLAAGGQLDPALLGGELAALTAGNVVVLRRVVSSLNEVARAGAYAAVWGSCAVLLPELLRLASPPPGTADLLALAATAAAATGTRAHLPEVAEVAGRRGSSRLVTEAKRLARALA